MSLEEIKQKLLALDDSKEMRKAIFTSTFYVITIQTMTGWSIGSMGDDLPSVYATENEAVDDNADTRLDYIKQIKNGEREKGDEWEGTVMKCVWDLGEYMELHDEGIFIIEASWEKLAGLK